MSKTRDPIAQLSNLTVAMNRARTVTLEDYFKVRGRDLVHMRPVGKILN